MDYAQLCCRNYASDACYPIKVEENQFAELSRFRIVPQLKYENHMRLIDALRDEESQSRMNNLYDLFFQEGESNIRIQKEHKDKPVCYGEYVQLFHEATNRYLKAIPLPSTTDGTRHKGISTLFLPWIC